MQDVSVLDEHGLDSKVQSKMDYMVRNQTTMSNRYHHEVDDAKNEKIVFKNELKLFGSKCPPKELYFDEVLVRSKSRISFKASPASRNQVSFFKRQKSNNMLNLTYSNPRQRKEFLKL